MQFNGSEAPKLTTWPNEPNVRILQGDLEASRPAHDTFVLKVKKWRELNEVSGSSKPPKIKGRSQVQPKLIRRQAEWRYSALTEPFNSSEKLFDVSPVTFEDGPAARQNELLLNWQFRTKLNRVSFIDNYVRANVDEGTAIVRVGWCRKTIEVEEDAPVYDHLAPQNQQDIDLFQQGLAFKQEDPNTFNQQAPEELKAALDYYEETGQVTVAVKTGTQKVKVQKVIENRPTLGIINPENFYYDPSCGDDLEKAGFVVISFETSKAELKKEPGRYKNLEFVNWESAAASVASEPNHTPLSSDTNFNFTDAMRKRIVAYEYWGPYDVHGTGEMVQIVATWIGNTLIRMEENPFPDGKHPFVVAPYMPIKRQVMGESDAELLEDNQKILGAVSRGMIDLMARSANGQQGFAKGMLDVLNRRRYENGQDYEFNPTINPTQGIIEHKYPEIPQSALAMLQMQNQEAEALTGVKAFSGGLSGNAYGDVAAGIRGILDAAAKREMAILRRLASGLTQIGRKIIAMNAIFLSDKEVIRVTNRPPVGIGHNGGPPLDDEKDFLTIKREDLAGDFDLKVDISTAEIDNNKAQDLAFMLQTMGNNMDFNVTKMILVEIARLKRMPELQHQIEKFEPKPDPMQQQLMQLQIAKEQKEIEKLQSDIELNQAKARSEMVKAEQGALNTVEQETGTTHAREMEKQRGQAEGNQDLEITKALVKPKKQANGGESDPDIEAAVGWNAVSKSKSDPLGSGSNLAGAPII
ncbi:chromosome partitioning protein ParB [Mesorhizobium sp. M4B.F.Ca.ET.058.02.1.1]|nr:chromosome partitioning protein ParB [Mesorhizobium sp. M4B.F.Ca.ET.058.02.1.1]